MAKEAHTALKSDAYRLVVTTFGEYLILANQKLEHKEATR